MLPASASPANRGHLRPCKLPCLQARFLGLRAFSTPCQSVDFVNRLNPLKTRCFQGIEWRRRRDSNPRDAFDAYAISSRAPSTKLGDSSTEYAFFALGARKRRTKDIIAHLPRKSNTLLRKNCHELVELHVIIETFYTMIMISHARKYGTGRASRKQDISRLYRGDVFEPATLIRLIEVCDFAIDQIAQQYPAFVGRRSRRVLHCLSIMHSRKSA